MSTSSLKKHLARPLGCLSDCSHLGVVGWVKQNPFFMAAIIYTFFYFGLGLIVLPLIEDWTVLESLYFSVIIVSTVGYGDITPVTTGGRVFVAFYSLMGVLLFTAVLGARLRVTQQADAKECMDTKVHVVLSKLDPNYKQSTPKKWHQRRAVRVFIKFIFGFLGLVGIGMLFSVYELGYNAADGFYFAIITGEPALCALCSTDSWHRT